MILREARGHAIVNDHTLLTHQYGVAGPSDRLFEKPIGIEAIHKLSGVGTTKLEPTQGADVDHTDARSHRCDLRGHAKQLVIWPAVKGRSPPEACGHPLRARGIVTVCYRRASMRVEPSPSDVPQRLGLDRRSRRGDTGFTHRTLGGPCHQPCSGQG